MPSVTGLYLYPVKSLRGHAVLQASVDALGFAGDRRFLVVTEDGTFLTQRTLPRMACISARLAPGELVLSADGQGEVGVTTAADPGAPLRTVTVWKSTGLEADDCGAAAAEWLSTVLSVRVRLVRIGPRFSRPVLKPAALPGDQVTFADAVPVLLVNEASVANLNDRILENHGEPVPLDRFRPNVVISGGAAFAEDGWRRLRIGGVTFRNAGPCARCPVTTTDQQTGERGHEPLRTLASFRRDPVITTNVNFGVNLIHETKSGTLHVGDAVEILE